MKQKESCIQNDEEISIKPIAPPAFDDIKDDSDSETISSISESITLSPTSSESTAKDLDNTEFIKTRCDRKNTNH